MKHALIGSLLIGFLALTGCDSDAPQGPTSTLTITFKALYDGQPLEKYKMYDYDTYQVQLTRFNSYIADITLLGGASGAVKIQDILWLNFTPDLAPDNFAVEVPVAISNVPDGAYTGIRLGYGVPPNMNALQPKDFATSNPLSFENEYWLGWASYIFNKIEGQVDLNKNGQFDGTLIYHCGSDAAYRTYDFNMPIDVAQGANLTVEFDLKDLFVLNGSWLDLNNSYNQITSNDVNDVVIANKLMDNFGNATTVK